MTQIFHPSMNAFAKATIFGAAFIIAGIAWAGGVLIRSSYMTGADVVRDQPVPFSHDHHVSGLGIDCRYCHTTVEESSFAGMPATQVCMNCHSQIWRDSPLLEPVRASYRTGKPLAWTRVHDLPDFVYFDHSIHVAKGVGCEECHGPVNRMPLMRKAHAMHMEWCLDCHEHPESHVRPRENVFDFQFASATGRSIAAEGSRDYASAEPMASETHGELKTERATSEPESSSTKPSFSGAQLVEEYGIVKQQLTNCAICHR